MPRVALGLIAALATCGCGLDEIDSSNVFPNNCGREGPVDLFDAPVPADPRSSWIHPIRAGAHVFLEHGTSLGEDQYMYEYWSVDRCGEQRTSLATFAGESSVNYGVAGDHMLTCDENTGAVEWLDPTGQRPPRPLFPSAEGCRVVPFGRALAVRERGTSNVYYVADPSDPAAAPTVITNLAVIVQSSNPDLPINHCYAPELGCKADDPQGPEIQAAGDELLILLTDGRLVGFNSQRGARIIADDADDLQVFDDRFVGVGRPWATDFVVDLKTGASFEMCCVADVFGIEKLGEWFVKPGRIPISPRDQWLLLSTHHVPTRSTNEFVGTGYWAPVGSLGADALLVDIADDDLKQRHIVWPRTGATQLVVLPGDVWSTPHWPGALAWNRTGAASIVRHLAGPDAWPRTLLEDVRVAFTTHSGHIVYARESDREDGWSGSLEVMLPDESVVELDSAPSAPVLRSPWDLLIESDAPEEVLYFAKDGDRGILRRTVLPRVGE